MKSILFTNSHRPTINVISAILDESKYKLEIVKNGGQALNGFKERHYDVVILDVVLPDTNGFDVCATIRQESDVPIIFLTSAATEHDKVMAFQAGADEYITKPFGHKEFIARLERILDRQKITKNSSIVINDITLNIFSKEVYVGDNLIHLTPTEFDLLQYLMDNAGAILSKEDILKHVWGWDCYQQTNLVVMNINRIRSKIGKDRIATIRQYGYKFVC